MLKVEWVKVLGGALPQWVARIGRLTVATVEVISNGDVLVTWLKEDLPDRGADTTTAYFGSVKGAKAWVMDGLVDREPTSFPIREREPMHKL